MSSVSLEITKFEAARRQLVTAIRLFFDDADSISVYTLGHAAWEVLDALSQHRGKGRFRNMMSDASGLRKDEIKKITNYGRNFFKHADSDPDGTLEDFSDDRNDILLFAAAFDFGGLADSMPMEVQVFQIWFFAAHPEMAPPVGFENIIEAAERYFSNIANIDRKKQKAAGLQAIGWAHSNPDLMNHPWTDKTDVNSLS